MHYADVMKNPGCATITDHSRNHVKISIAK